jgi:hypothetical protein
MGWLATAVLSVRLTTQLVILFKEALTARKAWLEIGKLNVEKKENEARIYVADLEDLDKLQSLARARGVPLIRLGGSDNLFISKGNAWSKLRMFMRRSLRVADLILVVIVLVAVLMAVTVRILL